MIQLRRVINILVVAGSVRVGDSIHQSLNLQKETGGNTRVGTYPEINSLTSRLAASGTFRCTRGLSCHVGTYPQVPHTRVHRVPGYVGLWVPGYPGTRYPGTRVHVSGFTKRRLR
eukprot:2819674-Rhodomonas_salina.1